MAVVAVTTTVVAQDAFEPMRGGSGDAWVAVLMEALAQRMWPLNSGTR